MRRRGATKSSSGCDLPEDRTVDIGLVVTRRESCRLSKFGMVQHIEILYSELHVDALADRRGLLLLRRRSWFDAARASCCDATHTSDPRDCSRDRWSGSIDSSRQNMGCCSGEHWKNCW